MKYFVIKNKLILLSIINSNEIYLFINSNEIYLFIY